MSDEKSVCIHDLLIRFEQMEDGTVKWQLIPDEAIEKTYSLGLHGMAGYGAPLAALGAHALLKLCHDGLVYHALEEANGVLRAVASLQAAGPLDAQLNQPMDSVEIH